MLKAKILTAFLFGALVGALALYFGFHRDIEPKGKTVRVTLHLTSYHQCQELFQQIERELIRDLPYRQLNLELIDPEKINELLSYFEDFESEEPPRPPHGYGSLCWMEIWDEHRHVTYVQTNYWMCSKNGRGDWQVRLGFEEFIHRLFLDEKRRDAITIEIRPSSKPSPKEEPAEQL